MRGGLFTMLLVMAAPAVAQMPGTPLRPGELALHIVARGEVSSRADRVSLPVTVTGRGPTAAAARDAVQAGVAQVTAALVAAGIGRSSITAQPPAADRMASFAALVGPAASATGPARAPSRSETIAMQVIITDPAAMDRVMQALAGQEQAQAGTPVPGLADEAAARRAAAKDAVGQARRDADDYAAALGMRVVRVIAASNAAGLGDGLESLVQQFRDLDAKGKASDKVITRATAVVDFAVGL
jgi:uncharacterized protein YggE